MMDIFHKAPDTRQKRWWRIPIPNQEYRSNYDDIFRKDKNKCAENVVKPKRSTETEKKSTK